MMCTPPIFRQYNSCFLPARLLLFILCTLGSAAGLAQTTQFSSLRQAFEQHTKRAVIEKVFVHTDREDYLAGETMWFKLYVVDGSRHQPLDLSKLAYVEVLDKENKPVLQAKTALENGSGSGSFYLPLSLKSGSYKLRAYTNWMKNFGPEFYFEKPVSLINTFTVPEYSAPVAEAAFDVQFFPEGGEMLSGIRSKVAFKALDSHGKGVAVKGVVVKEQGDTVAVFSPLKFGMGHFYFTPEANTTYKALVSLGTDSSFTSFSLPAVQSQGYVMQLEEEANDGLSISVSTNLPDQQLHLFVHTRQQVKVVETQKLTNGQAVFRLNKQQLGEGISHLTLINQQKQAVAERLYFRYPQNILSLDAGTNKNRYASRQQVELQLAASEKGNGTPANLSLAVYRTDSLSREEAAGNIMSYLWLSSDLKGHIESPAYYFSAKGPQTAQAMDNLMLTQGWRRFRWQELLEKEEAPALAYIPEYEGHIIRAVVTSKETGAPAAGVTTYLSVPGKLVQFYVSSTNEQGEALFITEQLYGLNDVILQNRPDQAGLYNIEISSPYATQYSAVPPAPFIIPEQYQEQLRLRHVQMQAQNTYWQEERNQLVAPRLDSAAFYRTPSKTYLLDNFTRFPTMEEVMREYVYEVRVRKQGGKFNFKLLDPNIRDYFENPPLVLLDGVPVTDTDKIIEYNPLKVEKLEVVTDRFFKGKDIMYDGIVSYTTYKGNLEGFPLNADLKQLDYDGLQLQREFYSPSYETQQQISSRKPDFRNLLHWSPQIVTGKDGKSSLSFYTSDLKGKFIVVVQGITPTGTAGVTTHTFEVEEDTL
ncbi:hypothetical protein [Cesiribacter sp. SM1]|uniref:hypothetical protein n=1 Tax=Cesiribacter sp. SM1 TaxID=2861196 RepID=UPI001CD47A24|nr:hypothetical protein [Cesiribacter sp. SM1]